MPFDACSTAIQARLVTHKQKISASSRSFPKKQQHTILHQRLLMSHERLKFMRRESEFDVFTEHPDHIRPSELSSSLLDRYGQDGFQISLRRNVYIIYVKRGINDQPTVGPSNSKERSVSPNPTNTKLARNDNLSTQASQDPVTGRRLSDVELARNVLLGKCC